MSEQKPVKAKPVFYACCYEPLKVIAKEMGYNLLINGSLSRDFDLVAVPWSDCPKDPLCVVVAFDKYLRGVHYDEISANSGYLFNVLPGGRRSYVIQLNRGGNWNNYLDEQWYLDISFTPQPCPCTCQQVVFPTREEAEAWCKTGNNLIAYDSEHEAAIAMYDWIAEKINQQKHK